MWNHLKNVVRGSALLLAGLTLTAGPGAASTEAHASEVSTIPGSLEGVTAVSATDVWAVGYHDDTKALIEHNDGTGWTRVPSAHPQAANRLSGVAAVAATDIWAVGWSGIASSHWRTLIEHWNGTTWSRVRSATPESATQARLTGVSATSASDAWAVGYYFTEGFRVKTIIEHWDGAAWDILRSPNPGKDNYLNSVYAFSPTDVWAVGSQYRQGYHTFTTHWDGTNWSVVPSPDKRSQNSLAGVSGTSSSDVWAVGSASGGEALNGKAMAEDSALAGRPAQTLIEHWDGSAWSLVPSPNPGDSDRALASVSAGSVSEAWAVGHYAGGRHVCLHWDGSAWKQTKSPLPPDGFDQLQGVTTLSPTNAWAVGSSGQTQHWDGTGWTSP